MKWWDNEWIVVGSFLVVLIFGSCLYHACINDDWKCGLPGVHCRREVKP